jgi:peptide/nickel transport system substrate-binding protein
MNSAVAYDNPAIWITDQIFDRLYDISPDGSRLVPSLATGYELSSDKLIWTFTLRRGVRFADGKPLTSADVKFSIDAANNPNAPNGAGAIDGVIKSVEAPSHYKVVIRTATPSSALPAILSMFINDVVPANYGGKSKAAFYRSPIGTGPFKFLSWVKGQSLTLIRNPYYWQRGKPYLDKVMFVVVPDSNTRILQLKGGQAQIIQQAPPSSVASLNQTRGVKVGVFPGLGVNFMQFNTLRGGPSADVHVRRAIALAIDRQSILTAALFNTATATDSFMPPKLPFYSARTGAGRYSVTKAKEELMKSRYAKGFTTKLLTDTSVTEDNVVAQIIQQDLKGIGITVTIQPADSNTEQSLIQSGKYDLALDYWTWDINDPSEGVGFGEGNNWFTSIKSPPLWKKLANEAVRSFAPATRNRLYGQLQTVFAQASPWAPLYSPSYIYAWSTKVRGFGVYPTGIFHLGDVSLGG